MGIFSSLLKYVTWGQLANLALEYGPELYKRARERLQREDAASPPAPRPEVELSERISRLEALLLEQENIISGQAAKNDLLEEQCRELESQLKLLKVVIAVVVGISLLLLVLLIMRW